MVSSSGIGHEWYFAMFSDDALDDVRTCLERGDCLTCLETASSACPAL